MDKRSLVFVVSLTASLFLVNQWFSSKSAQKSAEQMATPQVSAQTPSTQNLNPSAATKEQIAKEQFYVIENSYQQLVLSNIGGAIAEINLPFKSQKNQDSVVLPIEFDTVMKESFPGNDQYPSFPYATSRGASTQTTGGYYPFLRRTLFDEKGTSLFRNPSRNYAFNTLSDTTSTANIVFDVKRLEKDLIQFQGSDGQRTITKTYSFPQNSKEAPYCFEVEVSVKGAENPNLWITTGIPEVELISGNFSPALKNLVVKNQKNVIEQISLPKSAATISSQAPVWVCNSNGFFGMIVNPLNDIGAGVAASVIPGNASPSRITLIDKKYDQYPESKYPGYELQLPLKSTSGTAKLRVFAGPLEDDILSLIDKTYTNKETGKSPRFISAISFQGWFTFISEPFAKFLFVLMKLFYKITASWGISIILLTVALRVMLYPLNTWSIKSTLKMQKIAPLVQAIQEKHKKDPKRAQLETVSLYREKGVNPISGCLPILIQIPFLIGMFDLLKSTFELRGAKFITGWIGNLTAPDVIFSWDRPIFFFGNQLHLLPFVLGAVMFLQQKISSPLPKDQSTLTDQQKQQKLMGNIMVVVFTVMFYNFPSGLNIYWLSSMSLGILQQWITNKKTAQHNPSIQRVK